MQLCVSNFIGILKLVRQEKQSLRKVFSDGGRGEVGKHFHETPRTVSPPWNKGTPKNAFEEIGCNLPPKGQGIQLLERWAPAFCTENIRLQRRKDLGSVPIGPFGASIDRT